MVVAIDREDKQQQLANLFGAAARYEHPLAASGMGVRVTGVDLCEALSEAQVSFLLDVLSQARLLCLAGQDIERFSLANFERFANHWGAPIPHPSNFLRGGKPAQQDGASDGAIEYLPFEQRNAARANQALPGSLSCMVHESPAVLVATNLHGGAIAPEPQVVPGRSWHTDVEYEP